MGLDTLYEIVGSRFPVLSNIVACVIGAMVFGFVWYSIGRHYRNSEARNPNSPSVQAFSTPTATPADNKPPTASPTPALIVKKKGNKMTPAERERQRIDRDLNSIKPKPSP